MRHSMVFLLAASMICLGVSAAMQETHHLQGTVTSVDVAGKTLVVNTKLSNGKTEDLSFLMGEHTKITILGKPGKFEDVKAGDPIHVRYINKSHVHHAEEIAVVKAPAAKK
jgi:hypothetical protein